MGELRKAIKDFFDKDSWNYEPVDNQPDDEPVYRMGFSGDDGQWLCFAQARTGQEQFVFYSLAPVKAPEERRGEMAEFITRANYGMIIGNFEMDFADGEVRYKSSIDVQDAELTYALAHHIVYANVFTMNRYLKGISAVAFGNVSAVEGIGMVEGS